MDQENIKYKTSEEFSDPREYVTFKRIMKIAYPAIISMLSMNVMQIIDRAFLSRYNLDQFAASMPAGVFFFSLISIFMGIVTYVGSLTSQYYGAKRYEECAKSAWQGVFFSLISGGILLLLTPLLQNAFDLAGHDASILQHEKNYFSIIMFMAPFMLTTVSLNSFFNGIGDTHIPMWTTIITNVLNIFLDWALIFGNAGFPEMGIKGAAIATTASMIFVTLLRFAILFFEEYRHGYGTHLHWKFNPDIFKRLIRFGFPAGLQFFFLNASFGILLMLVGKLGPAIISAANMTFTVESMSFIPIFGLSIGISIVAGQEIGAKRIDNVYLVTKRGVIAGLIIAFIAFPFFLFFPEIILKIFESGKETEKFMEIKKYAVPLIKLTTLWIFFDAAGVIIGGVLRAAGDTFYLLVVSGILSITFGLAIPSILILVLKVENIFIIWGFVILFIFLNFLFVLLRFLNGAWKNISVID